MERLMGVGTSGAGHQDDGILCLVASVQCHSLLPQPTSPLLPPPQLQPPSQAEHSLEAQK